ncbi:glycosyltransferase family 2 protein [bacterium]|nr:glycosyltransferase family 2 protein [bacterium]
MQSSEYVGVIVPTHNRRTTLLRCLESVRQMVDIPSLVVVVFDGCTDGSQQAVRDHFPDVLCVEGDGNLWWSGAINAGIRAAEARGASHFFLLNDDVLPDPMALASLMEVSRQQPAAIIGSQILALENRDQIWCVGGGAQWSGRGIYMLGNGQRYQPGSHEVKAVDWLPGMGTLIPGAAIAATGGMDTRHFPQYFGDTDFSMRARKKGFPVLVCPKSLLFNETSITGVVLKPGPVSLRRARDLLFSRRSHANIPTRLRFWLRHCPPLWIPWQVTRFYLPIFASLFKKILVDGPPVEE